MLSSVLAAVKAVVCVCVCSGSARHNCHRRWHEPTASQNYVSKHYQLYTHSKAVRNEIRRRTGVLETAGPPFPPFVPAMSDSCHSRSDCRANSDPANLIIYLPYGSQEQCKTRTSNSERHVLPGRFAMAADVTAQRHSADCRTRVER